MKSPYMIPFFIMILLVSCISETQIQQTDIPTMADISAVTPTNTAQNIFTEQPPDVVPEITESLPVESGVIPVLIGTPIASGKQPIASENIDRIAQVAQWGRGQIQGVRFSPDGKFFVLGTALGLTVYDMNNLEAPPDWVSFDVPHLFNAMYFSEDGQHLLFLSGDESQIREFSTGKAKSPTGVNWIKPLNDFGSFYDVTVRSPDGSMEFRSRFKYEYNERLFSEEYVVREMYNDTGDLLYVMPDDIPYITYDDRVEPEGCDLGVFSPCGNALMSLAMSPGQTEFSPLGDTFAILYTVPSLGGSEKFSFLRIYDSSDGSFIMSLGGREHPISAFAYTPDAKSIGVAYLDGSVQIWNIGGDQARFGARHMNASIGFLAYTSDSKYLLIQRNDELEIRQTTDGSMIGRFDAAAFAISPRENIVAIGDDEGMVRIRRIDTGENVLVFQAHSDMIYSVTFSDDGLYLATGGRDCDVKMWDAKTGQLLHYFEETRIDAYDIGSNSRIFSYSMKFIPNTDRVIGFGSWGTAVVWDIDSGATQYVIQSQPLEFYNGMWTVKPHFPEYFWVDQQLKRFYINEVGYDLETGDTVDQITPAPAPEGCWAAGPKTLDGRFMITRGYNIHEGELCVLDTDTRELVKLIQVVPLGDAYFVDWPYMSPDGTQLLVTTTTGVILVYQVIE